MVPDSCFFVFFFRPSKEEVAEETEDALRDPPDLERLLFCDFCDAAEVSESSSSEEESSLSPEPEPEPEPDDEDEVPEDELEDPLEEDPELLPEFAELEAEPVPERLGGISIKFQLFLFQTCYLQTCKLKRLH